MLPAENLLKKESSPYLLQHRDNPVHWRAWNDAALAEARETGKPILLSVGYAACHWCHVMAHECFEDEETARLMNRIFVNIKVDREERPEIDQIYMAALTAMGEQGGWPLTMFLTPDARPFWGGTYFPREPRYGRPGFGQVLTAVEHAWREKEGELGSSAARLEGHVSENLASQAHPGRLSMEPFRELTHNILNLIDREKGGLRGAPKFPNSPFMNALWLNWLLKRDGCYRDAVLLSLRKMLAGGIYDHVGGGLARYSTDADWLVPHFEKMLYDNAQLIRLCNWAHAETREPLFRHRIEETAYWLLTEMRTQGGAFAASFDADSAGGEGAFYLWTQEQIERALGPEAAAEFLTAYNLAVPPEWENDPILCRLGRPEIEDEAKEKRLRQALDHLREERSKREPPARDDKILVDWNGLAIAALAEAGRAFTRKDWIEGAQQAFRSITGSSADGQLPHSLRNGAAKFPGLASDYAAMINAAISLYQATWNESYLRDARRFLEALGNWHGDGTGTGYFLTASDASDVPMRIRGDVDEAIPSATAQIIEAILRLAEIEGDAALMEHAVQVAQAALGRISRQPYGQAGILHACALVLNPMKLVLVGENDAGQLVSEANRAPDPRRVDRLVQSAAALTSGMVPAIPDIGTNDPVALLCHGPVCLPPIRDARALVEPLRAP